MFNPVPERVFHSRTDASSCATPQELCTLQFPAGFEQHKHVRFILNTGASTVMSSRNNFISSHWRENDRFRKVEQHWFKLMTTSIQKAILILWKAFHVIQASQHLLPHAWEWSRRFEREDVCSSNLDSLGTWKYVVTALHHICKRTHGTEWFVLWKLS